jgi:FtsZ-binding cell division protein ZapB
MQFIANKFNNSSVLRDGSTPSRALLVTLVANKRMEITTGKLNTAISTLLLLALEAIPEIKLSEAENPHDVNASVQKKSRLSWIGFPMKTENKTYPNKLRSMQRAVLYTIFATMMSCGRATE